VVWVLADEEARAVVCRGEESTMRCLALGWEALEVLRGCGFDGCWGIVFVILTLVPLVGLLLPLSLLGRS